MYGFVATIDLNNDIECLDAFNELCCNNMSVKYNPMPKFINDKLFYQDTEKIVLLDGAILNRHELIEEYSHSSWKETFETIYKQNPEKFMSYLRGPFCGLVYCKLTKQLTAFTNFTGEKIVYYYSNDNKLIVANHMDLMVACLKKNHINTTLDANAAREMFCAGSYLHGRTVFKEVIRLMPGKSVIQHNNSSHEERYHMFSSYSQLNLTIEEAMERFDFLYRQAISRIYSKNEEYGYKHVCDLSAGLDSRMAVWVGHQMGYTNQTNICYSQSKSIDHTSSQRMAKDLGHEYIFYPLDGGKFLEDVDEVTKFTGGQVSYIVCTGANNAYKKLQSPDKYGISITGLMGELSNAYWVEGDEHTYPNYTSIRYDATLSFHPTIDIFSEYETFEQCNLYEFGCMLFLSSALVRQHSWEVSSPFIDKELLEFCMRLPISIRKDFNFVTSWIKKYYPGAAKYVWQTKRRPIDKDVYLPKFIYDTKNIVIRIVNKLGRTFKLPIQIPMKHEMNPFQVWEKTNPELQEFAGAYSQDTLCLVTDTNIKSDLEKMLASQMPRAKWLALSYLATIKRYY